MEELYTLSDGSKVDLSGKSQFEITSFLIKNPGAKKQKGVAKSAVATPKKTIAPEKNTDLVSKDGSSEPRKWRLPNQTDLDTMQNKGILPPSSANPVKYIDDYKGLYDLKQNEAKVKATWKDQKIQMAPGKKSFNTKVKFNGSDEEIQQFVNEFRDNPVTGELGEDSKYKILKAKESIHNFDLDVSNPYMFYSSVNQDAPDDFVEKNFKAKELQDLGVNTQDFDGFLNKRGYKNDYLDKESKGLFTGEGRDAWGGYDIGLSKELAKKKLLNMYMEDMKRRDFSKQDLNQDIQIATGDIEEKNIIDNELFDTKGLNKYVSKNFPILTQKLKDRDAENAKIYQESKKGGTDFFSWDTASKMGKAGWNAISDRTAQLSASAYSSIGMEGTAEGIRMLDEENKLVRPDDRGISYVSGKSVKHDGTNYIVDSKGEIYDKDSKIRVTDLFNDDLHSKIVQDSEFGSSDWVFSTQGAAVQTSGVMVDMLMQAAVTRGVGALGGIATGTRTAIVGAGRTSKFTSLLNDTSQLLKKIPLDRGVGYSMIAQGALGYSQGFEDTLKAARDNGETDEKAFKLASAAGQRMAILYSTTGVINPQTEVAENLFGSKNIIKKAMDQYLKVGEKGFVSYIDDVIKNTPRNLVAFAEEGAKEVVQENIQQIGEIGVNKMTNRDAGQKIMNETMTGDDFMNTSILSFISSGLISKMKMPSFYGPDQNIDNLTSLSTLAKNKIEFNKIADGLVGKKVFTIDQVTKLKEDVDIYANNINKLPTSVSSESAMPVLRKLDEISKLEGEKKRVDKSFHGEIDDKIDDIRESVRRISYEDALRQKNKSITKAIEKGVVKNTEFKTFSESSDRVSATKQLEDYFINEFGMPKEEASYNAKQRGVMMTSNYLKSISTDPSKIPDGKKFIFVNDDIGYRRGVVETGQHEFLHGLLRETLKDPETQQLLGVALSKELTKLKISEDSKENAQNPLPKEFFKRFSLYTEDFKEKKTVLSRLLESNEITKEQYNEKINQNLGEKWEEALTLYSDAISNGTVKYEENAFNKLKDVIRVVLQNLGLKDIKFESGRDVYNFLKDYNKSVESGTWGKAMTKLGNKGAEVNREALRKETGMKTPTPVVATEQAKEIKFSLDDRKSSEQIKKDINSKYDKEKWSVGSTRGRDENPAIERVIYDILGEYDYMIRGKAKALRFTELPGYNDLDMIAETHMELMPHIRNFNREFFEKREEYKKELIEKGFDPNSKEFKDTVETKDEKGYEGKKRLVKENDDLNAWINSQLVNKMNAAIGSGNVAEKKYTEDIQGEMFKESKISDGFGGDESYLMDEGDNVFENVQEYEVEQQKLAVLLKDPVFRFVDENGKDIDIETIPFGSGGIVSASDPTVAANRKLKTETDPAKIAKLKQDLKDFSRGLELEAKKDITYEEKKELESLKSFKSYDLSNGMMVNTFKALSVQDTPSKIVTDEVAREIFRSPNIATLEYRNFKERISTLSKTMARRMTFKNGPEIESFMYNQWELLYGVINHPIDPVTGESSYASKKLPPTLKEFDDNGNLRKVGDITRVKFIQAYYDIADATRIINTYGGENASKEIEQLEERELNPKTGGPLSQNAHFDRRTALMELFGDVMVLQEARRLLRNEEFLNQVAERQVNLYNDLKDDMIRAKVLENMAKGKSDVVKFSLAEEENGDTSSFLEGLPFSEQWVVARDIDNAIKNAKMATSADTIESNRILEEIKKESDPVKIKQLQDELLTINRGQVTFKVPSILDMTDKEAAYLIIQKAAAGYNNFEFMPGQSAETPLLKQVMDALDFKSKKYQETLKRNNNIEGTINDIIEENKGIASSETFSPETAKNLGKNIGKHELFLPPEDEDFEGLLYTLGSAKGTKGEEQLAFLRDNLLKPYSDAMLNLMKARQVMYKDWKELINKKYKGISKELKKDSGYGGYLTDQAVRVYLWKKAGYEIPGLDNKDIFHLLQIVRSNKQLRAFADDVSLLSKQANGYVEPGHNWGFGSVVGDINNIISKSNRAKYLEPWVQNIEKAFSKENLSKIEAIYGRKYVVALKNTLDRMKTGSNRAEGQNDNFLNWLNGATAVTMFANIRSAVLQTIGAVNYINTSDNNVLKAGKALLNVPQYMSDFQTIWNSDYLKDRRSGLMNDVAEAELAQIMNDPRNISVLDKLKAANYWILKNGYAPTRLADSFAIAFGGAGFYRNRINTYLKQGLDQAEAERLTMRDFYEVSEVSQQSADVSKISMNQASVKGRLILAFQNTPLQYSRLIKKSVIDLVKGRGSAANNIAKIVYYSAIQNMMFNFLQNALFSMFFDDDDEIKAGKYDSAMMRATMGTMDTLLRGSGLQGAMLATAKNAIVKAYEVSEDPKGYGDILLEIANLAPSIGIKARAITKSYKAYVYNKDEIRYKGFSIDNTYAIEALTSITSATTNVPVDRLLIKIQNVGNALNSDYETWQRIFSLFGYSKYNLGLGESGKVKLKSSGEFDVKAFEAEEFKSSGF